MSHIGARLPTFDPAEFDAELFDSGLDERDIKAWQETPVFSRAAADDYVDIMDVIGEDFWGDGVSAKSVQARLDALSGRDITVRVNSPGGNFYDGLAIYNALAQHSGKVTVHVLAMAASAASVLIMAADEILMGSGSQIMIHEARTVAIGTKADMAKASEYLGQVDQIMHGIYAARTGLDEAEIAAMIEAETFMDATTAVEKKFADGVLSRAPEAERDRKVAATMKEARAKRVVENALKAQGMTRSQASEMLVLATGTERDAGPAQTTARDAGISELSAMAEELQALLKT